MRGCAAGHAGLFAGRQWQQSCATISRLSVFGMRGRLSHAGNTRSVGVLRPIPSARRCSFCVRQCARSSLITEGGSVIVRRPCFVFGALKRRPAWVCSSDCSTRRVRLSRSMLLQRNAQSSPRLKPLPKATIAIVQRSALRARRLASIALTSFSRRISISACCTRGGCTSTAGFCVIRPHWAA